MAVFTVQAAGSRTRPASREACRRAAVKPRPTGLPPSALRASGAQSGVQGVVPKGRFDLTDDMPNLASYWLDENEQPVPTGRDWRK